MDRLESKREINTIDYPVHGIFFLNIYLRYNYFLFPIDGIKLKLYAQEHLSYKLNLNVLRWKIMFTFF